jgi:hypothetical protein
MHVASDLPIAKPSSRVIDDDDDYEYYWSAGGLDVRIPRWLAEILDVPLLVRWELLLIGVCAGLILAALAVLIAFYSAV